MKYIPAGVQLTAMMDKAKYLTGKGVAFVGKDLMINEEDCVVLGDADTRLHKK